MPTWILFELVVTKLPHYVLPLYPAIAILIAGVVAARALPSKALAGAWDDLVVRRCRCWSAWSGLVGLIFIGRQFGFLAWPLIGASMVMGFRAWQLYRSDGAEHSLAAFGAVAALLMAAAIFGLIVPSLHAVFPSVALAKMHARQRLPHAGRRRRRIRRGEPCLPRWAQRPVTPTAPAPPISCAAANAALHSSKRGRSATSRNAPKRSACCYSSGPRIEGFNMGNGRSVTIAVYRSGGPP